MATVKYKFASNGKLQIESKDDIKRRGLKSPDLADSFVLTFAEEAVIGVHGAGVKSSWNKPLRRNVPRLA